MVMRSDVRRHALTFLMAGLLVLRVVGAVAAEQRRCEHSAKVGAYLTQPVAGIAPEVVADEYINERLLAHAGADVRRFWAAFGTSDGDVSAQIDRWNESVLAKNAVRDRAEFIETARQVRATIIEFERARVNPEQAAELLAGQWDDWRNEHMTRETYVRNYLQEVAARQRRGETPYRAELESAQSLLNRLDDLHDAAGTRPTPEDPSMMWLWDQTLRSRATADAIQALAQRRDGNLYWNLYVFNRRAVLRCVVVDLERTTEKAKATAAASFRDKIDDTLFPTAGYFAPNLLYAIFKPEPATIPSSGTGYYLAAFLGMFLKAEDAPECHDVVDSATQFRVAQAGSGDILTQILGGLAGRDTSQNVSRDELFRKGAQEGFNFVAWMAASEKAGEEDAREFYRRYGCKSPVARRFFDNLSTLVSQDQ